MSKLEIKIGDAVFEATTLDALAPVTCATLLKYLPLDGNGVHAGWSGDCIYVHWGAEKIAPEVTSTIYGSAGDVVWNATSNDEIFITHRMSQYRWRNGPLICNPFAKITDNLEQLNDSCVAIQQKGPKRVSVRVK
jgi:hypothetical protein